MRDKRELGPSEQLMYSLLGILTGLAIAALAKYVFTT